MARCSSATAWADRPFGLTIEATVATTMMATITPRDTKVGISGAHPMCSPPLMKGTSFSCMACRMSLTPMNARISDSPCLR